MSFIIKHSDDPSKYDIVVTAGPYEGITYRLGEVQFPEEDEPILQFSYDIIEGELTDKAGFEQFVGDSLVQMLQEQLQKGELVYTGGT